MTAVGVVAFARTARKWCARLNKIAALGGGQLRLEPRHDLRKSSPVL
jgi:hypothetical protein